MPVNHSRLFLVGLIAALIAGCGGGTTTGSSSGSGNFGSSSGGGGGGGGGGNNNPTAVTLTFPSNVSVVAAQVGSGAYAMQTISNNQLSLSIPSGTSNYAVAYICPQQSTYMGLFTEEAVWEASTADGASVTLACMFTSYSAAGMGSVSGSVDASAIPGAQSFAFYAQNGSSIAGTGPTALTANINAFAPPGNDRALVLIQDAVFVNNVQGTLAAKSFTIQGVPGPNQSVPYTMGTVTFTTADETTPGAITYNNVPSGFGSPSADVQLQMVGETGYPIELATQATTQYPMLPAAALESGDLYVFYANAYSLSGSSGVIAGSASAGGPVSLTFPAPWTYAGPTAAAQPTFDFSYTGFSGQASVEQYAQYTWKTGGSGQNATVDGIQLTATTSYQGTSTTLTVPDLSSLTGFLPAPASGMTVDWYAELYTPQFSSGANGTQTLNSSWSVVSNGGSFTVP